MDLSDNSKVMLGLLLFATVFICLIIYYIMTREVVWPYSAKPPLTEIEQKLYFRLLEALPNHIILAQVSLYGILKVESKDEYMKYFNKIRSKSLDFVVCEKDFSIVAAIELDDRSHEREERIKADYEKDTALRSAGVRIIRWPVKDFPSVATIKQDVLFPKKKSKKSK